MRVFIVDCSSLSDTFCKLISDTLMYC
jgi:hypothetical protein